MGREYEELKRKKEIAHKNTMNSINNFGKLADETYRVADVARNAESIIIGLDKRFEEMTKLSKTETSLMFLAVALQCARQHMFTNENFRLTANDGDKIVKGTIKRIVPKSVSEILCGGVPYDAISRDKDGELFRSGESAGLAGTNHRYKTLGHDPVLGWIFGPINIITDSLTKSDVITTYSIRNSKISGYYPSGTIGAFNDSVKQVQKEPQILMAAVARQAIHFGSDYFTKQGLPIPLISTASPEVAQKMIRNCKIDMYSLSRSAGMATLINMLIKCIHQMFCDENVSHDLNKIRSNKIIMYSNVIASSSNVLNVAISKELHKLDAGGMLVTMYRLINDIQFQKKIKREFIKNEFYNIVMGEEVRTID